MEAEYSERRVGDIVVIDLEAPRSLDPPGPDRYRVSDLLDRGETKILLDLRKCAYVSSDLLGQLVANYSEAADRSASLRFVTDRADHWRILEQSQLDTVFEIFRSEEEGLESFRD